MGWEFVFKSTVHGESGYKVFVPNCHHFAHRPRSMVVEGMVLALVIAATLGKFL